MNTSNPDELSMSLPLALDNRIDASRPRPAAVPQKLHRTRQKGESLVVKDVDEFRTESNHSK